MTVARILIQQHTFLAPYYLRLAPPPPRIKTFGSDMPWLIEMSIAQSCRERNFRVYLFDY